MVYLEWMGGWKFFAASEGFGLSIRFLRVKCFFSTSEHESECFRLTKTRAGDMTCEVSAMRDAVDMSAF